MRFKSTVFEKTRKKIQRKSGLSSLNLMLITLLILSWIWIIIVTSSTPIQSKEVSTSFTNSITSHSFNKKDSQMNALVQRYQQMKWKNEQEHSHSIDKFNLSYYQHVSSNKLFNIWTQEDLKDQMICPIKYPDKPPKFNDMKYICSHLHWFKFGNTCNDQNCSDCIPPNSKVPGQEWTNKDVAPWIKQYELTIDNRRNKLKTILHSNNLINKNDGPIIAIIINHGYSFLFYNWVCSLDNNGLSYLKNRTIIVPTQKETIPLIIKAGFKMIFYPDWLGDVIQRIEPEMPKTFALGAHRWVQSVGIALVSDLIHLGYDVVMQDSDIIYVHDPLYYLMQPKFKYIDIQMTIDGRTDRRGPGNSGYYIIRSNCKTKVFMKTMIKLIGAVLTSRSDQILWNSLINEKQFRMINFQTLPSDYFVGGNQVNIKYGTQQKDLPPDTLLIHASWTTDQFDKIEKFWNVEHYYFTEEKCPQLYDYNMLPDLKDKKWHIRAKTKEQEEKLLKLGLVRDTSNGYYTTPKENK